MPAYKWDAANGHYRTERGRYIPASEIRKAVDATLDSLKSESDALTARLAAGTLDVDDWHVEMRRLVKQTHAMSMMAAVGGRRQMTASLMGQLGARCKAQYTFLAAFRTEIANDAAGSAEAIAARARMYIHGGSQTYEAARRPVAERAGYRFERRYIHSGRPCGDCIGYAAQGWVPIGTLPPPGADCECISSCRCTFAYRKAEGEPSPRPKAPEPKPPKPARQPPVPKPPPEPRTAPLRPFGKSKAPVEADDPKAVLRTARAILGRTGVSLADLASLAGAPDDVRVFVSESLGRIDINFYDMARDIKAARTLARSFDGDAYVRNTLLEIGRDHQGGGFGRRVLGRQIEQAARLGVKELRTDAARSDESGLFGYRVWPRLGYDGPIPEKVRGELPRGLKSARNLSDLMRSPEGRAWWDANGVSVEVKFDLAPGSLSRRVFDTYRREREEPDDGTQET